MKKRNNRSGQSLLEFALFLPLLMLLVMGLFDIGRAVVYYAILNTAVREGTRYAIVLPDCDYMSDPGSCSGGYLESYPLDCESASSTANVSICDEITNKLFNITDLLNNSTITITHKTINVDDMVIEIEIEYTYEPITPGAGLIGDFTMQVNSEMLKTPIAVP
jgi:hypothetical protein